jgi:retron-type reverse transcriptase
MRNAATILAIHRKRGADGLPLDRVYKHLFDPELFLRAYGKIYRNHGAMTEGVTAETVDGMSLQKIHAIIDLLKQGRYCWTPVRRTEIPKPNGKRRPLGIPTWSDKLVQEVLRTLLEPYYEQRFSCHSHGFRPDRGCHSALLEIRRTWKGTVWFIEGDIKGCFDNIDHGVLLGIIRRDIHDGRLYTLIEGLLKAGYMEGWRYYDTLSGTPQGGIISPRRWRKRKAKSCWPSATLPSGRLGASWPRRSWLSSSCASSNSVPASHQPSKLATAA